MSPSHVIELIVVLVGVVGVITGCGALFSLGRSQSYDK